MTKEQILIAVRGSLSPKLFSEIVNQFNDAEDDFRENITLRDRVDWLEKQLSDIGVILRRKQPEQTFADFQQEIKDAFPDNPSYWIPDEAKRMYDLPTMDDVRNTAYRARRDRYFDSLRGRDKAMFSTKEEA